MKKKSGIIAFIIFVVVMGAVMGTTTKDIVNNIKLGLDLQGGFEVLYKVSEAKEGQKIDQKALSSTVQALDRRINVLGVSEPNIQIEGNNRIRVQLAGVEDQNQAREILSTEANLTFRDVNDRVMLDGSDLKEGGAKQSFDENGRPIVALTLKDADKFRKVTQEIKDMAPNNYLVIWLDYEEGVDSFQTEVSKDNPKFVSAPRVDKVLNENNVSITGNFTIDEAKNLADILNAGALPVKLDEIYSTSVGAQFGESAMQKTVMAGLIGVGLVFLFMLLYYRLPGFISIITLTVYIYLVLLVVDLLNVVLTLPGIAALILGVGMAVDANIITAERIKEEIKVGKSIRSAFKAGSKNAFTAVLDSNLTTILAAAVLFFYGASSVKGFATNLIIGILGSFITNVFLSRWLLGLFANSGMLDKRPGLFGVNKNKIHDLRENIDTVDLKTRFDHFDFVKVRRKLFAVSGTVLVAGIVMLIVLGLNLSIDFTSGTRVEILAGKPITKEIISSELDKLKLHTDNIVISGDNNDIGVAKFKGAISKNDIAELKTHFHEKFGADPNVSSVTPTVGKELAKNAILGVLIASVGLILFVSLRFEWRMALPAVIALLFAAFIIIPFFSILRVEVDLTFIAALLTIVGYSINDTIVTFDRMRENMQKRRRIKTFKDIEDIANTSIRQTLTRSINTVLTVTVTVIALIIFGSESIRPFSIALTIGLVIGTYSSVFIAAQLWVEWKSKQLKKVGTINTYKEKRIRSDEPQV